MNPTWIAVGLGIVIVLVWAGWFISSFIKDRNRSAKVKTTDERFAPQPGKRAGSTSGVSGPDLSDQRHAAPGDDPRGTP